MSTQLRSMSLLATRRGCRVRQVSRVPGAVSVLCSIMADLVKFELKGLKLIGLTLGSLVRCLFNC